ncbi:MAG: hypothetical protein FWD33_00940 [Alphaproteobacteria bacterium]|nr:hypothetical protein [Alphaproteobacteria bacterium]
MTHEETWRIMEIIAERNGKTLSGLARMSGLDATAMNPSKRLSKFGQARWPTVRTVCKVLEATDTDLEEFIEIWRAARREFNKNKQNTDSLTLL